MKKILCSIPVLAMLLALAGCCANDTCNCEDELADALFFTFRIGGPNGFQAAQVDTLFIVRIPRPTAAVPRPVKDSILRVLPLGNGGTTLTQDSLISINNASPFALSGGATKLTAYDYEINAYQTISANGTRTVRRQSFKITNAQLAGQYDANGCCTCYINTGKQFDLSGRFYQGQTLVGTLPTRNKNVTAPIDSPLITALTTL